MIPAGTLYDNLRGRLNPLPEGHAVLGLSGGADSVALLYLLLPDVRSGKLRLEACHVNHGLRGKESDADMDFTRTVCEKEGIPWHGYSPDLKGRTDENTARETRYGCFLDCLRKSGSESLILAHQMEDEAETYLLRLVRGAGPEGLSCIRRTSQLAEFRVLRPMLSISRKEIRMMLTENGISWREDLSNQDERYLRNRIRSRILPALEECQNGAVRHIAMTAEMTDLENESMNTVADKLISQMSGRDWFRTDGLIDQPHAIRIRALRRWWNLNSPRLDEHSLNHSQSCLLDSLVEAQKGTKINLPGGCYAVKGNRHIHLVRPENRINEEVPVSEMITPFGELALEIRPYAGTTGDGKNSQVIPESLLQKCTIRTRRKGDRIRPFGFTGFRKLQDYLTDRKVDAPWRDRIPLLCSESEVLMVCGVGTGGIPPYDPEKKNVTVIWHGPMPWNDLEKEGET